ncbi:MULTISPECIES: LDCC motif putative metal-binding protein [Clostridium]|nr:LDCC motif putative metal-binding protein [Clostridium sporogenes]AVP59683.1 hypothetical protein C7M79_02800 [Clostridium botulinum]AKJ89209.1 hypothetical protein CLSPOx_05980 [Clostridium sporogenes]EHN16737.1 hypothetical protein IYC_02074 [Clostridium sporogenes PA 3679]MDU4597930.1 LDCC motif putative metal-binding protein [Clostridium sporogenes]NFF67717.1 hypothetical protein [Clostridium sporogenes]
MKILKKLIKKLEKANEKEFENKRLDCCDLNKTNRVNNKSKGK